MTTTTSIRCFQVLFSTTGDTFCGRDHSFHFDILCGQFQPTKELIHCLLKGRAKESLGVALLQRKCISKSPTHVGDQNTWAFSLIKIQKESFSRLYQEMSWEVFKGKVV